VQITIEELHPQKNNNINYNMHYITNSFLNYPNNHQQFESTYMKRISPDSYTTAAQPETKQRPSAYYSYVDAVYPTTMTTTHRSNSTSPSNATSTAGIQKKKRKTKKNKIIIPMKDMIRLFSLPQTVAAKKLNVSISTLKRRFYELEMPKWPANHTLQEFNLGDMNPVAANSEYHKEFVNSSITLKQNAHYYLLYKEPTSQEKADMGTIMNLYDTAHEKDIDPMTLAILHEAFNENTPRSTEDLVDDISE
jgi:hypothetical protein